MKDGNVLIERGSFDQTAAVIRDRFRKGRFEELTQDDRGTAGPASVRHGVQDDRFGEDRQDPGGQDGTAEPEWIV